LKQITARLSRYVEPDISEARGVMLRSQELPEFMDNLHHFYSVEYPRLGATFMPGRIASLNGKNETDIQDGNQFKK